MLKSRTDRQADVQAESNIIYTQKLRFRGGIYIIKRLCTGQNETSRIL